MKAPFKHRTISTAVIIPSAVIIAVLAVLQYRWSTGVSEATAVRLADSLQMSMMNWQKDLFRYFSEISLALRIDPVEDAPNDVSHYVRRFAEWRAVARYPKLVSSVYLVDLDPDAKPAATPEALRLNSSGQGFDPHSWPAELTPVRADLERVSAALLRNRNSTAARTDRIFDVEDPSAGWLFDPAIPALFHPMPGSLATAGWIAVELDREEIQSHILADLSRTYFQGTDGLDYLVAVVSSGAPGHVMYSSDAGFGYPEPADADGAMDLFGRVSNGAFGSPVHVFHAPSNDKGPDPAVTIAWFPFLRETAPKAGNDADWRLIVRHRRGGALGAFVVEMRRRDLAIGFGVLLVLAVNMGMLIVTSHRAQQLAQLQVDFVTTVSHELRTPLTVIISGADNICKGVVETRQQMTQYGSVISNQAKQLLGLVERILLFAATRQGPLRYHLRPLEVQEVVDAALAATAGLIEASRFTVECEVEENAPRVLGDAEALSQCLQNLITNAVKYSSAERWIGLRARLERTGSGEREVAISVSDHGAGISASDLPHIFEPFFRSPAMKTAQIHGTGLGLPLSRSIAEAMRGRLTVESVVGQGSTFTLHLPAVAATELGLARRPAQDLAPR